MAAASSLITKANPTPASKLSFVIMMMMMVVMMMVMMMMMMMMLMLVVVVVMNIPADAKPRERFEGLLNRTVRITCNFQYKMLFRTLLITQFW